MKKLLALLTLCLGAGLVVAKLYLVQVITVEGDEMVPTLQRGDLLLAYRLQRRPGRGQLVLVEHPTQHRLLLRRVIGLPGERVKVKRGVVYVDDQAAARRDLQPVTLKSASLKLQMAEEVWGLLRYRVLLDPMHEPLGSGEVSLVDEYFVMADNRRQGSDSRTFGPLPADAIRAVVVYRLSAGEGSFDEREERDGLFGFPW